MRFPPGYTITGTLQEGDRTIVHRAIRDSDQRPILIKALRGDHPPPREVARLRHEWAIVQSLDLPSVVAAHACEGSTDRPFLVLEDFGGVSLEQCLDGPTALSRFLPWAVRMATALADIHGQRVIHRDIKPQNVIVAPATGELKITDFGIASQLLREQSSPGDPRQIEGTLAYMSPEQTGRMNRPIDYRTDLYSLGVTFYQMLTGTLPFSASDAMEWVHCHIARRPRPPHEIASALPRPVSDIVMRLLAKMAEERYQSATGLALDLERCLTEWQGTGSITPFPLGQRDVSDQFHLPHQLYGREAEVQALVQAFERVVTTGTPEILLVAGYSGIGKTALVQELYRPITGARGHFIAGKFDQYKRGIPYAIITQAFGDLVQQLLTESDEQVAVWRARLQEALGINARLLFDVVPLLEQIIGEQPAAAEVSLSEAQNRFHLVFRRFVSVFTRPEHPLVVFLDDLQWVDAASLKLVESLMTDKATHHVLLIGAYRDNEVSEDHPLTRTIDAVRRAVGEIGTITLGPLSMTHLTWMIAAATREAPVHADRLARLVHAKTGGNPFFAIQFLTTLHREGLIAFDRGSLTWQPDLQAIEATGFTDNVIDLMVGRLRRLPARTLDLLKLAAAVGNQVSVATLAALGGHAPHEVPAILWEAQEEGLLLAHGETVSFLHDRVQQAAYSLLLEGERPALHLRIGRMLLASHRDAADEQLFEILEQLTAGVSMITDPAEGREIGLLSLKAAEKAIRSTAYADGLRLAMAAWDLLQPVDWQSDYEHHRQLYATLAEAELLTGHLSRSQELITAAIGQVRTNLEKAELYNLLIVGQTLEGQYRKAVESGLTALAVLGVEIAVDDPEPAFRAAVAEIDALMGDRRPADLLDLPRLVDPTYQVAQRILLNIEVASYIGVIELYYVIVARTVRNALIGGNSIESCKNYGIYGLMLGDVYGDYRRGHEFAQLGWDLVDRLGAIAVKCKTTWPFTVAQAWVKPLRETFVSWQEGIHAGQLTGDIQFTTYLLSTEATYHYIAGVSLPQLAAQVAQGQEVARSRNNQWAVETLEALRLTIAGLRQRVAQDGPSAEETAFLAGCATHDADSALCIHHCYRAQRALFDGAYEDALRHAERAQRLTRKILFVMVNVDATTYQSLALLGLAPDGPGLAGSDTQRQLDANLAQLRVWVDACAPNCAHKLALVEAEAARVAGRDLEAMNLYESAIRSARENGFVQDEGLACELGARFLRARGFDDFADTYLRRARQCHVGWGADGLVRQLDERYPQLREAAPARPEGFTSTTERLDVTSVVKATQAISSEIILPDLLETLVRLVVENAGAQRGVLLRPQGDTLVVEAASELGQVDVSLGPQPLGEAALPLSLIGYVKRTRAPVILADAAQESLFAGDVYFARARPKSVLCVPIVRQAKLVGIFYLENNLATHTFTPERAAFVELLAGQAAISLENSVLYADLQRENAERRQAEAAVRASQEQLQAILDNSTAVIFLKDTEGRYLLINRRFEQLFHISAAEIVGKTDFDVFPEATAVVLRANEAEGLISRKPTEREEVIPHDDGAHTYIALRVPLLDAAGVPYAQCGIATDITERKQAESLRSELATRSDDVEKLTGQLRQIQKMEAIGRLAGGVAHDFNNLLTIIGGCASLLLSGKGANDPRGLALEIQQASDRAAELTRQLLAFSRRQMLKPRLLQLNDVVAGLERMLSRLIGEDIELLIRPGVDLGLVRADPGQLEQVIVNLAVNARDAMPEGGTLTIETSNSTLDDAFAGDAPDVTPGDHVMLAVSDTGVGMDVRVKARLFEPFFTTKEVGSGTGLGLSTVYGIVKQSGGHIGVTSEPGVGTTFRIHLPRVTGAVQESRERVMPTEPPAGREVVLLVEDDAMVRSFISRELRQRGYQVLEAASGPDALALSAQTPGRIDILVTDVVMRGMNGRELAHRIEEQRPGIRALFMSGYTDDAILRHGVLHADTNFLQKPFTADGLARAIRESLER